MTFEKRLVTALDYEMLSGWWQAWGWDPVPFEFLAPTGFIISKDGKDICASWLYCTDTPICWHENFISDKGAAKDDRDGALDYLIAAVDEQARVMGFRVICSAVKHNGLMRRLEKHGFNQTDTGMTHFIKGL